MTRDEAIIGALCYTVQEPCVERDAGVFIKELAASGFVIVPVEASAAATHRNFRIVQMEAVMIDDILKRLREGTGDGLRAYDWMNEAADIIERQREALRGAREALNIFSEQLVEKRQVEKADEALAAIDEALKEQV